MALSEWPDHFKDDPNDRNDQEYVTVEFEVEMLVKRSTGKAIGLYEEGGGYNQELLWIPISQIDGPVPKVASWISSIRIPRWLADEKNLEYEE